MSLQILATKISFENGKEIEKYFLLKAPDADISQYQEIKKSYKDAGYKFVQVGKSIRILKEGEELKPGSVYIRQFHRKGSPLFMVRHWGVTFNERYNCDYSSDETISSPICLFKPDEDRCIVQSPAHVLEDKFRMVAEIIF